MFTVLGQHFFVDILCCRTFCPHKNPHNATLFYCGTRIQGRRHLVTAALSLQSCAYRSLLPSSGDLFPHLVQKRRSRLGFVTYLLTYLRIMSYNLNHIYICWLCYHILLHAHGLFKSIVLYFNCHYVFVNHSKIKFVFLFFSM